MEIYEPKLQHSNWGRSEFDFLSWHDLAPDDGRGRQSTRQPVPVRSRSEDYARPQYAYQDSPQYRTTSPDIRRTRNHSPRQRRPMSLNSPMRDRYGNVTNLHSLPPSEPIYHDIEEERIHSRSLSPARQIPAASTERVNLYASPFHSRSYDEEGIHSRSLSPAQRSPAASRERSNLYLSSFQSPAQHRQASIERLAVKAAASKPTTRGPPSPQRLEERAMAHSHADSLLMFSDPVDAESALTGWSQQELIKKKRKEQAREARRKEKRYGKKKDKKKPETRILNMPPIHKATSSPSRRKLYRGVDPLANDVEQKPRNLISRYTMGRTSRMVTVAPASSCIDRRSWRITPAFSRSDGEMESTQSSNGSQEVPEVDNNVTYASLPITPSHARQTDADIHAQATGEWMRSNEKTASAKFVTSNDAAENPDDSGDVPFDENFPTNSNSSMGSDDERPLEEDGSFPSLRDSRHTACGEQPDKGDDEVHHYVESVTKQDDHYRTAAYNHSSSAARGLSSTGDVCDSSDKISEDSPVSVMAVHRAERQRLYSAQATPTRQNHAHQPRSILRRGKHSGAHTVQEYHKIIAGVRSHRVRFHDGDYRSEREVTPEETSDVRSGLHPSTEPHDFSENDRPQTEVASFTSLSPPRHREELDEDERMPLSPIEEEHTQYVPGVLDLADDMFGTDDYPCEPEEDKVLEVDSDQKAFEDPAVYEREIDCESMMSEFSEFGFMEAVAAIVIQTAVRRMLAMNLIEKMLQETYPDEEQFETMAIHMQNLAASQIQAAFRGWWVRDSLNVDHFCARRIQRAYRSFRTRMRFIFDVYRIIIVQSIWRRKMARDEARHLRRASRSQSVTPCWQSSKVRHFLKEKTAMEDAAAVAIQSRWRAYDAHMIYLYNISSIMVIQSIARRWLTKPWLDKYLRSLDPPAKRSLKILDEVCTRRQHSSEGHVPTRETSSQFGEGRAWAVRHRVPTHEPVGTLGGANRSAGIPEHSIESPPLATETDNEATADVQHRMSPPKLENPSASENKEEMMTREKVREANERDRKNAKMSGSVANFWKSQDKSSASKVLYHRKDMKPKVEGRNNGQRIPESNKPSFVQDDENNEQVNGVEVTDRGNPQKRESPPPTESKEANTDVQRSSEMESSPLSTEIDDEATADAQHRFSQPEMENSSTSVNQEMEEIMTREKVWDRSEYDRRNAKMSGSVANFWKSQDESSASKALYRRRDGQVNVVEEKNRGSPQDTEIPLLTESKARTIGVECSSSPEKTDNETAAGAQQLTNPPKIEPPTIEEANELDIMNAKMSGSVANFWKSKDQGSANKALYRRKDMQPAKRTPD